MGSTSGDGIVVSLLVLLFGLTVAYITFPDPKTAPEILQTAIPAGIVLALVLLFSLAGLIVKKGPSVSR